METFDEIDNTQGSSIASQAIIHRILRGTDRESTGRCNSTGVSKGVGGGNASRGIIHEVPEVILLISKRKGGRRGRNGV